ncbi:MAG: hypothetical protein Q8P50_02370 [Bacillota bacterium]|nr:hypothetical protein [Bacillota bacterium]
MTDPASLRLVLKGEHFNLSVYYTNETDLLFDFEEAGKNSGYGGVVQVNANLFRSLLRS